MRLPAAWRSRWWWWLLPLLFCVLNVGFLWFHHGAATSGFRQIQNELTGEEAELKRLRRSHQRLEEHLSTAERNRAGVVDLYESRLATEEQRLTDIIVEVKSLARRARLEPPSITYSEKNIEEFGLIKRSIVFGVQGSYAQIRELINFLEISERFLILEEIRVREVSDQLGVDLTVSTLFARAGSSPSRTPAEASS